jgi:hypothetical protein
MLESTDRESFGTRERSVRSTQIESYPRRCPRDRYLVEIPAIHSANGPLTSGQFVRNAEEGLPEPALPRVPMGSLMPDHRQGHRLEIDGRHFDDQGDVRCQCLCQPSRRREHEVRLGDDQRRQDHVRHSHGYAPLQAVLRQRVIDLPAPLPRNVDQQVGESSESLLRPPSREAWVTVPKHARPRVPDQQLAVNAGLLPGGLPDRQIDVTALEVLAPAMAPLDN